MLTLSDIPFSESPPAWPANGQAQHGEKGDPTFPPTSGAQGHRAMKIQEKKISCHIKTTTTPHEPKRSNGAGMGHPPSYAGVSPKQPRRTARCFTPSPGTLKEPPTSATGQQREQPRGEKEFRAPRKKEARVTSRLKHGGGQMALRFHGRLCSRDVRCAETAVGTAAVTQQQRTYF